MVESWSRLPRHPAAAVHSELRRARGPQRERLIALPDEPRREHASAHRHEPASCQYVRRLYRSNEDDEGR
ncbi:CUB and sushi domain-containing protein 3 isoform X1 [Tachysurus ichikawai]